MSKEITEVIESITVEVVKDTKIIDDAVPCAESELFMAVAGPTGMVEFKIELLDTDGMDGESIIRLAQKTGPVAADFHLRALHTATWEVASWSKKVLLFAGEIREIIPERSRFVYCINEMGDICKFFFGQCYLGDIWFVRPYKKFTI